MTTNEILWHLRYHPITANLTNEEYEELKRQAYENKMLPATYAAHILRRTIERAAHDGGP